VHLLLLLFLAHQHKSADVKIKLSKNNDHIIIIIITFIIMDHTLSSSSSFMIIVIKNDKKILLSCRKRNVKDALCESSMH